eukprot:34316_3
MGTSAQPIQAFHHPCYELLEDNGFVGGGRGCGSAGGGGGCYGVYPARSHPICASHECQCGGGPGLSSRLS